MAAQDILEGIDGMLKVKGIGINIFPLRFAYLCQHAMVKKSNNDNFIDWNF